MNAEFKELRSLVFTLYQQKAYADALALIDERAGSLRQFASDLLYWRACLCGCIGDKAGALGWLQQAADSGCWYHERMLNDADLAILQGTAEMAQLQTRFQERWQREQAMARPERQTWEPAGAPQGLLVALHGAGGSILSDGDRWRPATDYGWRVAAVQSSQLWAPGRYHWADGAQAATELQQHLTELGPARHTVLGGFSMGAALAMRSVLSGSLRVRRFFAVAPSFRLSDMEPLIATADRSMRGYIVVGDQDNSCQPALQLAALLNAAGLPCAVARHQGLGHDYPVEFAQDLDAGLSFLVGKASQA